jgi:hypothetical protein
MDSQKVDPHPTPVDTDSTQTNESVVITKPEDPVDKDPSYLRSREIALKKFIPQGRESG